MTLTYVFENILKYFEKKFPAVRNFAVGDPKIFSENSIIKERSEF